MENSTLNISSKGIKSCKDVAKFLADQGILCHVSTNTTVFEKNGEFTLEKGCEIKIVNHKPSLVDNTFWNKLKTKFELECAHIAVDNGRFSGCVYDYLRESACPHKRAKLVAPA